VPSIRARALAPWSASKVQTALRCPREFYYRYIDKVPDPEGGSPESRIGKAIHSALEKALTGTPPRDAVDEARADLPSDTERTRYDRLTDQVASFVERIDAFRRRHRVSRQMVEYTLAVREDFTTTQFHSKDAFFRGVIDLGFLYDDGKLAVVDHKSGERRTSLSFQDQLEGYAVLAAPMFRFVRSVYLGVYWVSEDVMDWSKVSMTEVSQALVPRALANIEAAALAVDDGPRPAPSDWCLFCSYRSICPAAHDLLLEPVEPEPRDPDW